MRKSRSFWGSTGWQHRSLCGPDPRSILSVSVKSPQHVRQTLSDAHKISTKGLKAGNCSKEDGQRLKDLLEEIEGFSAGDYSLEQWQDWQRVFADDGPVAAAIEQKIAVHDAIQRQKAKQRTG